MVMPGTAKGVKVQQLLQSTFDNIVKQSQIEEQEYKGAPLPLNETQRLITVNGLKNIQWVPQSLLDDFTDMVCTLFDLSISFITMLREDQQWFPSGKGLGSITETPRCISFCAWGLLPNNNEVLYIPDARADLRFYRNPVVCGPMNIRSYIGCPMVLSNGHKLGNLCGLDTKVMNLTRRQIRLLCNLTEILVREIEREKIDEISNDPSHFYLQSSNRLSRPSEVFDYGYLLLDVSHNKLTQWKISFVTEKAAQLIGKPVQAIKNGLLQEFFKLSQLQQDGTQLVEQEQRFQKQLKCSREDGSGHWLQVTFIPAYSSPLDEYTTATHIPDDIPEGSQKQFYFVQIQPVQLEKTLLSHVALFTTELFRKEKSHFSEEDEARLESIGLGETFIIPNSHTSKVKDTIVSLGVRGDQNVIVKCININDDRHFCDRVLTQLAQLQQKQHANIVRVIDYVFNQEQRRIQIVCEYCDYGNLNKVVSNKLFERQKESVILDYCIQIAEGVQFLHQVLGIVHGRLSPENVLFCSNLSLEKHQQQLQKQDSYLVAKVADGGILYPSRQQLDEGFSNVSGESDCERKDIEDLGRIFQIIGDACACQALSFEIEALVLRCTRTESLSCSRSTLDEVIIELRRLQDLFK